MSREKIYWPAELIGAEPDAERAEDSARNFVQMAQGELADLYVPDSVIAIVESAGCTVEGPRYFAGLYSHDPKVTTTGRLKSAFTGSVAHSRANIAGTAYAHLTRLEEVPVLDDDLIDRLNIALSKERRAKNWTRVEQLEGAAKALGKPLRHRFLGGLATAVANNL